ncbi:MULTISPECIES: S-Ena type endospore appendage [Neobacillus]|uniref:Endospore appendages core domain-containing protein n=1 Tax=Neobacillus citreus TaxID=2833578 RepID=A0A942YBJ5_9BACI|nr:S-Ena type endospore appendage [Neobacillus citreus]MCH6267741.1 hypothetical protein [Neobacillus citreus]
MNFMSEVKKCNCGQQEQCTCKKRHMVHSGECEQKHHHYAMGEMRNHCNHQHEVCPEKVKGFNLCRRRNELRCFKQCEPISQPCDGLFYNYFTSRTNFEFSGLVVVTNTGNPTSGCSMQVRVTDRAGTAAVVATVSPGASVPIFVEGLTSLDIACVPNPIELPVPSICSGEIRFDLEYCAATVCF